MSVCVCVCLLCACDVDRVVVFCCDVSMCITPDSGVASHHLLVGTYENFLAVFKDTQLLWISKSDSVPVALRVAGFAYGFLC